MQIFVVHNIFKRTTATLTPNMKMIIAVSMTSGIFISILYFIFVVLRLTPWYQPQHFIPIAGMIIGNSMTGISLGVNQLLSAMGKQKEQIEGGRSCLAQHRNKL